MAELAMLADIADGLPRGGHPSGPSTVTVENKVAPFFRTWCIYYTMCVFSITVTRVATFKELDSDLVRHTGFLSLVSSVSCYMDYCNGLTFSGEVLETITTWSFDCQQYNAKIRLQQR